MGVWTLLGFISQLPGKGPTAPPFCLPGKPSSSGQELSQAEAGRARPLRGQVPRVWGGGRAGGGAPWASAAAPKWPGDVGLPCVQWIMTVFLVLSLFMPAL